MSGFSALITEKNRIGKIVVQDKVRKAKMFLRSFKLTSMFSTSSLLIENLS